MARRFTSNRLIDKTTDGKQYIRNVIYPDLEPTEDDIYVIATIGDRYDKLAMQFYQNIDFWWIIAAANSAAMDSLCIEPGVQIRIPVNTAAWQEAYEQLNNC